MLTTGAAGFSQLRRRAGVEDAPARTCTSARRFSARPPALMLVLIGLLAPKPSMANTLSGNLQSLATLVPHDTGRAGFAQALIGAEARLAARINRTLSVCSGHSIFAADADRAKSRRKLIEMGGGAADGVNLIAAGIEVRAMRGVEQFQCQASGGASGGVSMLGAAALAMIRRSISASDGGESGRARSVLGGTSAGAGVAMAPHQRQQHQQHGANVLTGSATAARGWGMLKRQRGQHGGKRAVETRKPRFMAWSPARAVAAPGAGFRLQCAGRRRAREPSMHRCTADRSARMRAWIVESVSCVAV